MDLPLIILAGGEGTRLKSVVPDRPKPLAPVAGIPFLRYLIENLYQQGIRKIILSVHHRAEQIEQFVRSWQDQPNGLELSLVCEPEPLGTGGAVRFVTQHLRIQTAFFVANGDTFLPTGLRELKAQLEIHQFRNAIGLVQVGDTSRYGRIEFASDQKIISFHEKRPEAAGGVVAGWINSGLYYLQPEALKPGSGGDSGQNLEKFSLETLVFPELVAQGNLYGACLNTDFIDIGIPSDYHRFESFLFRNKGN